MPILRETPQPLSNWLVILTTLIHLLYADIPIVKYVTKFLSKSQFEYQKVAFFKIVSLFSKAMNLVYENRKNTSDSTIEKDGVLKTWLMSNSTKTIPKFLELEAEEFKKPLQITSTSKNLN